MDAPPGMMSPREFNEFLARHTTEHYEKQGEKYVCKKCGADIWETTGQASLHSTEFGDLCSGTGEVRCFALPYCPNCEGSPKQVSTCVHMKMLTPGWVFH